MLNRITALRVATAMLYLGPLLAGLTGAGWALVPIFVVLFLLWIMFLHPELAATRAWFPLFERGVIQALLVTVFFGIGRGMGGVVDLVLPVPVWLTVLLSVAAIFLGRMVCNPATLPPEQPRAAPINDL